MVLCSRFGFLETYLNGDVEIVREYGLRRRSISDILFSEVERGSHSLRVSTGLIPADIGERTGFVEAECVRPVHDWAGHICPHGRLAGGLPESAHGPGGAHSGGVSGFANNQQEAG